jgi:hypothetical protein
LFPLVFLVLPALEARPRLFLLGVHVRLQRHG